MRLDQALVQRNLYTTRARAVAAIKSGLVLVNGAAAKKPSQDVLETDVLTGGDLPYSAGRGSLKLEHALRYFNIVPVLAALPRFYCAMVLRVFMRWM